MKPTTTPKQFLPAHLFQNFINKKLKKFALILFLSLFSLKAVTAQLVYAVSTTGSLVSFNAASPSTIVSNLPLTGLTAGQTLQGLDFRPATGQLYALAITPPTGRHRFTLLKPLQE